MLHEAGFLEVFNSNWDAVSLVHHLNMHLRVMCGQRGATVHGRGSHFPMNWKLNTGNECNTYHRYTEVTNMKTIKALLLVI
jgi:hypothetical protein